MKQQVVFIHGGEAFSDYDAYLEHLKNVEIENPFLVIEQPKRWKHSLREALGEDVEVALPHMPCHKNAKYEEWKIWFERHFKFIRDDVVLIGHSQGGYFLVKYLTENTLPVSIKALFLVAAPFAHDKFEGGASGEDGGDFNFDPKKLPELEKQAEHIFIYHSKDDFVVPFSHGERYSRALPKATLRTFKDRGHFLREEFPELVDDIKASRTLLQRPNFGELSNI